MILFGDIASPTAETSEKLQLFFNENSNVFIDKNLIYNFEGVISDKELINSNNALLYNHESVLKTLNRGKNPVFCLANNHILDLPDSFDRTIDLFRKEDILFCGAGKSKEEASKPITFNESGKDVILFNACWNFLLYSQRNPSKGVHIAEINEEKLITNVKIQKEVNQNASIVVFLHWSLDQETLPFPMYRQFSRALIDAGAGIVVGSHSHCVQGGEKYKDGFIIYGLGNFFIPHNVFIKGRLKYPDFSKTQMIFEWDPGINEAKCHWFEYNNDLFNHKLIHLESDIFEKSENLKKYSPFQNMSDSDYLTYFKKHRRKKILIPVYKNYKKKYVNKFLTFGLKNRARFAHLLARLKIINWQN